MGITALTNWEYYNGTYKEAMGNVTIPQADFPRYTIQASKLIRKYTFGNIDESKAIVDDVQCCCCELAEQMYQCAVRDADSQNNVTSEKDGSWAVSYESREKTEESDLKVQKGIIYNWLINTGLMYSGV